MYNLKGYKTQIMDVIQKQLDHLDQMSFPDIKTIENFSAHDEVFKLGPKQIMQKYELPIDGNQVVYMMTLEGLAGDQLIFKDVIEGIKAVKEQFRHELTQITSINNRNYEYLQDKLGDSVIMYIGTSQSFAGRIKTHVGFGSKDTATVCLKGWPVLQDDKFKFKFQYYDFGKDISPEILKFFEYYLSNDLRPLIGHNRRS